MTFDIIAKAPGGTPPHQVPSMLKALLSERFGLTFHYEHNEVPVYVLTVATPGRLGGSMRESEHDCARYFETQRATGTIDPAEPRACRFGSELLPRGRLRLNNAGPITALIGNTQGFVDRPIINGTGLKGNFEWKSSACPCH